MLRMKLCVPTLLLAFSPFQGSLEWSNETDAHVCVSWMTLTDLAGSKKASSSRTRPKLRRERKPRARLGQATEGWRTT